MSSVLRAAEHAALCSRSFTPEHSPRKSSFIKNKSWESEVLAGCLSVCMYALSGVGADPRVRVAEHRDVVHLIRVIRVVLLSIGFPG